MLAAVNQNPMPDDGILSSGKFSKPVQGDPDGTNPTRKLGYGRTGKGIATCRTPKGWSAPAPITITGGSWGLQLGGQAVDLVMVIMNDQGIQHLLASKFKLGAEASAAAGPVGRDTGADTDWKMKAEVLTYSRARGIFAGIDLNGAVVTQDKDETRVL